MIYSIQAQVVKMKRDKVGREYRTSGGVPTFFLDSDIQGIVSAEHAERIAQSMLSHGDPDIIVHAIATKAENVVKIWSEEQ